MAGIKLDRRDGVLTITLSRPERLNAVDGALTEEMLDAPGELARDPTTRFVVPFTDLGLSAGDCGLSWLLPRLVGPTRAAEIFYRAQRLDVARADALGLITEITAEGADMAGAQALADELLAKSPYGLRRTKELLNASLDAPGLRRQLAAETAVQTLAFFSEDLAEGMTAALEKRRPEFKNR